MESGRERKRVGSKQQDREDRESRLREKIEGTLGEQPPQLPIRELGHVNIYLCLFLTTPYG